MTLCVNRICQLAPLLDIEGSDRHERAHGCSLKMCKFPLKKPATT